MKFPKNWFRSKNETKHVDVRKHYHFSVIFFSTCRISVTNSYPNINLPIHSTYPTFSQKFGRLKFGIRADHLKYKLFSIWKTSSKKKNNTTHNMTHDTSHKSTPNYFKLGARTTHTKYSTQEGIRLSNEKKKQRHNTHVTCRNLRITNDIFDEW